MSESAPTPAMTVALRRTGTLFVFLIAAGAAVWTLTPPAPNFDDPYIALHAAEYAFSRIDPAYQSPPLSGATSLPFITLLVLLRALGLSALTTVRLATVIGATAFVFAVWMLGRAAGLSRVASALLSACVLGGGFTWFAATNGLETGLAMAVAIAAIVGALQKRLRIAGFAAALLPWIRPDLAPASAALLLFLAWPVSRRRLVQLAAIAAVTSIPWLVWMRLGTGHWTPQTIEAKYLFFAEACQPLTTRLATAGTGWLYWLILFFPASLGAAGLVLTPLGRLGLIAILGSALVYALQLPGAVWHNYQRYLYPIALPWIVYGAATGVRRLESRAVPLLVPALLFTAVAACPRWFDRDPIANELIGVARWIEDNTPPAATILTQDAGAVSVFAHRHLVDVVGLKSPMSIEAHRRWTLPSCGQERGAAIAEIATRAGAAYLVTNQEWEDVFKLSESLRARGFAVDPVRVPDPALRNGYTVWRLTPPNSR